jgi:folate-binding protein YgfZ
MPKYYVSTTEDYRTAIESLGIFACDNWGRLRVKGEDALDLLNRLSTNNVIDLKAGDVMNTVLTSSKGRIIDLLQVANFNGELIVTTSPGCADKVIDWLDFYTFDEDITVENISESTIMLGVIGPDMPNIDGFDLNNMDLMQISKFRLDAKDYIIMRTDRYGMAGFDIITEPENREYIWNAMLEMGAKPVGEDALETIRIEKGIPMYGSELNENYNPLEAGVLGAVNFEKGCYIGQEVVLRLKTYDKVQRNLVGILLEGSVSSGDRIEVDGKEVGLITSVSKSITLDSNVALGYVRSAFANNGERVTVTIGDKAIGGEIINLPLI